MMSTVSTPRHPYTLPVAKKRRMSAQQLDYTFDFLDIDRFFGGEWEPLDHVAASEIQTVDDMESFIDVTDCSSSQEEEEDSQCCSWVDDSASVSSVDLVNGIVQGRDFVMDMFFADVPRRDSTTIASSAPFAEICLNTTGSHKRKQPSSNPPPSGKQVFVEPNTEVDVYPGRGAGNYKLAGNAKFRQYIRDHLDLYQQTQDQAVRRQAVNKVIERVEVSGGRFLAKNDDGFYYELDKESKLVEKICRQAFRTMQKAQKPTTTV